MTGKYSGELYISYCTFYVLGNTAAMIVPFIGFQPLTSNEHMAGLGVFGLMQLVAFFDFLKSFVDKKQYNKLMISGLLFGIVVLASTIGGFIFFGKTIPFAGRFYSLWDTSYARKSIPIVASVSEHQPSAWTAFFFDLQVLTFLFPAGLYFCFKKRNTEHIFLILYALTASYFAGVMIRLMLTLTPIVCILAALAASNLLDQYMNTAEEKEDSKCMDSVTWDMRLLVVLPLTYLIFQFILHSTWATSTTYSSPSIILTSTSPSGEINVIDDFREAYSWIRNNTPVDSKIMAWWDYGYQLAGMADRITLTDNNTWNNTHIATIAKAYALPEEESYKLMKSLDVDYIVLLSGALSGFNGDDMNKFLWMVRIAEGVYPEIKEIDFYNRGAFRVGDDASQKLKESIMYKMSYYRLDEITNGKPYDRVRQSDLPQKSPKLYSMKEAYSTENFIVRIFKLKEPDFLGRSFKSAVEFEE